MRIIGLTDLHDRIINFDKLLRYKPDVILLSGDIIHKGDFRIIDYLMNLNNRVKIFLIPGNWETEEIKQIMNDSGLNIDEKTVKFEDTIFMGLGGSNITPICSPNEYSEDEIYDRFIKVLKNEKIDIKNNFIMVSHVPPKDTMADRCDAGNVGSSAVRKIIEEFKPVLCACGHVHESRCIDKIGNTLIVNPSSTGFFIYDTKTKNLEIHDL
ncbi:metallophosphoesterase [Methanococcus maripaludis C5]|uniref:Metallophosphoesterase n=1 Tax=Methanococcus maripaludis (strain C5 / ATCC BAA-1333) TaxID=402880 RepID=A4G0N6_METM5|nr:metallophosphoesterase [Methanococcus maripaludis]ABO36020.1 metallophosphoesterase [Methanococcus maripaludis C5]